MNQLGVLLKMYIGSRIPRVVLKSCTTLCNQPQTIAHEVFLSMGFSWQECFSGLPFPPLEDLPDP